MTSSHLAILNRPRPGITAASIGAGLGLAALALGITIAIARADNPGDAPQPATANMQRTSQTLPPARVILPAPVGASRFPAAGRGACAVARPQVIFSPP
ncbi:hypothetical protein, partial [Mammaliicoccus sciuri]|uniref:hypothetical protein n=1 Tax=Mammaliicoccus sciuri TaxID=1296 RepID=UPI0007998C9F